MRRCATIAIVPKVGTWSGSKTAFMTTKVPSFVLMSVRTQSEGLDDSVESARIREAAEPIPNTVPTSTSTCYGASKRDLRAHLAPRLRPLLVK